MTCIVITYTDKIVAAFKICNIITLVFVGHCEGIGYVTNDVTVSITHPVSI